MILVTQTQKSTLLFTIVRNRNKKPLLITKRRNILKNSLEERTDISIEYHAVSGVENIWKTLALSETSVSAF